MARAMAVVLLLASCAIGQELTYDVASVSWAVSGDSEAWIKKDGSFTGFYDSDTDDDNGITGGFHNLPNGSLDLLITRDSVSRAEVAECSAHVNSYTMLNGHEYIIADAATEVIADVDNTGTPVYQSYAYAVGSSDITENLTVTDANRGSLQWVDAKLRVEGSIEASRGNLTEMAHCYASIENDSYLYASWEWNTSASAYQWKVVRRIRNTDGTWEASGPITTWHNTYVLNVFYVTTALVATDFEISALANYSDALGSQYWVSEASALTAGQTGAEDYSRFSAWPKASVEIISITAW
jgi:hypothetical protein